jgi:putative ABC transport system ATP-binding protein
MKPDILMADEPTGSLDHATGQSIIELMFELNREAGTALVLVTHDMGLAQRCERLVRIEAGRLSEMVSALA